MTTTVYLQVGRTRHRIRFTGDGVKPRRQWPYQVATGLIAGIIIVWIFA